MAEKLLLSPEEGCEVIGVGRVHFFKMIATGEIPSFKIGRLRKIRMSDLKEWIDRQTHVTQGQK